MKTMSHPEKKLMKGSMLYMLMLAVPVTFSSCMKEKNYRTYTISTAEYTLKPSVVEGARLQSAEKIENPGSFVLYQNIMFVNEKGKGVHFIDYSDPANPQNKNFLPIPGNTGLSIRDNILYADCFGELFCYKLLPGNSVELQAVIPRVFQSRQYNNDASQYYDVTWHTRDTTVEDNGSGNYLEGDMLLSSYAGPQKSTPSPGGVSVGSSMAVFAIIGEHLYTVDQNNLYAFSLKDPVKPVLTNQQIVTWNVETIFPFTDKLFIGSMNGTFIYSLADPAMPKFLSQFSHARRCDPVIADGTHAFVTLRSGNTCAGFENQLDVLDISDISNPRLLRTYPFSNPHGLSKDGAVLFLCDGTSGLRVLDASDVNNITTRQTISAGTALDVVAMNQLALVMLQNGIQIYSYDQQFNIQSLGSLNY